MPAAPNASSGQRRPLRRAALAGLCLALVIGPAAVSADTADAAPGVLVRPTTPSQEQVDGARRAATDKASQVAAVQAQLDAADAALDAAQTSAAIAAESYDAAADELATRTEAARSTAAAAADAEVRAAAARAAVGRLAAGSYRSGGDLDRVSAFLSADGPQDLLDRASLLDSLAQRKQRAYEQLSAAESVAAQLTAQSQAALADQQEAADAAAAARDAAQRAADGATALVATTDQARTALVGELAQLQGISTALAAQRQAGLAAQAAAAAEAQARSDRARRQAAAAAAAGATSGSGSTGRAGSSGSSGSSGASAPAGGTSSGGGSGTSSGRTSSTPAGSSSGSASAALAALAWARTQIGDPYAWGATGPDSWDCSGLTSAAFRAAGVSIPRTSAAQYRAVAKVSYDDLRPGDLIFYGTDPDDPSTVYHVAVYAGGGDMVEAPRTGLDVRETAVRYANSMTWAGRP